MNPTLELYNRLEALSAEGNEEAIINTINELFPSLPESVQSEVLTKLYFMGLADDTIERKEIADLQKHLIEVLGVIEGQS